MRGVELNNAELIGLVSFYYDKVDNHELQFKYGLMAIEMGEMESYNRIVDYCFTIKTFQDLIIGLYKGSHYKLYVSTWKLQINNNYEITKKLIEHLVEMDDSSKFVNKLPKIVQQLRKSLREQVDIMELHFNYAPGQAGFKSAKADFIDKMGNC